MTISAGSSPNFRSPAPNSPVLDIGSTVSQVVAGLSGGLRIVRVSASLSKNGNGPIYTMSLSAASGSVPASVTSAPFWCGSACGDLIGVGSTNHVLYLLNTALATRWTYTAPAAINTTPVADVNGDWYFGADDGYVYDVEIPATGATMFNAARFGPIGPITSSPIEAPCSTGPCIYFASTSSGYFCLSASTGGVWARHDRRYGNLRAGLVVLLSVSSARLPARRRSVRNHPARPRRHARRPDALWGGRPAARIDGSRPGR